MGECYKAIAEYIRNNEPLIQRYMINKSLGNATKSVINEDKQNEQIISLL